MMAAPKFRFKGFAEDWEQRKLGELCSDFKSGNNITAARIDEFGEYPVYGGNGLRGYTDTYTHDGDYILIGRQGALCGNIKTTLGKAYISEHAVVIGENEISNIKWLEQLLIRVELIRYSESSAQPGLSVDKLKKIEVFAPPKPEQTAIGNFFRTLDDTITLHKRKLDGLKELKKAYLQQMFPQAGERVPRVRFAGFSGDWMERPLKDLITPVVREVPKPETSYVRLSVRSHAKGAFHQVVDDPSTIAMDKLYVVKVNDLIVNITFAWEHAIAVAGIDDDGLLVSHRFPTFLIDKSDVYFIRQSVSFESFRYKLDLISPGGAGRNRVLNKNDFLLLKINAPQTIKEQTAIGSFFRSLDEQIVTQQTKLDKLKQLKAAYLQNMFV